MGTAKIGNIDGHDIFVDTGVNEVQWLQKAIKREVERNKLTVGKVMYIPINTPTLSRLDGTMYAVRAEVIQYPEGENK